MNPIEKIFLFGVHVWADGADPERDFPDRDFTIVEVVGSGLNETSSTEFADRSEAVAYANRISDYYGVEVTDLGVAE